MNEKDTGREFKENVLKEINNVFTEREVIGFISITIAREKNKVESTITWMNDTTRNRDVSEKAMDLLRSFFVELRKIYLPERS